MSSFARRAWLPQRLVQVAALAGVMAFGASCADQSVAGPNGVVTPGRGSLSVAPSFQALPPGTPTITLSKITGILISPTGDSIVVNANFDGDSAVLTFDVHFTGTSAPFTLDVTAYDSQGVIAYHATEAIVVKSGANPGITPPTLVYAAPDAKLTTLHISSGNFQLSAGGSATLSVTGTGADGTSISPIRVGWASSNATIATVDANGVVRAQQFQGSATITATSANGISAAITVNVEAPVSKVLLTPPTLQITRGQTGTLTAVLNDVGGNLIADRTATWTSSDQTVATVSTTGVVTAIKLGTTTITATAESHSATSVVTVVTPLDHIEVTPAKLTLASLTQTSQLNILLVPTTGGSIAGIVPVDSTSDSTVAVVDSKGNVTAVGNGTARITVTADGKTAFSDVTVHQVTATITLAPASASVSAVGSSVNFAALVADALHQTIKSPTIAWTSSDPTVATVTQDGTAVARKAGTVTITATTNDGFSASATFIIAPIARTLVILSDKASIAVGAVAHLQTKLVDDNGNAVSDAAATLANTTPNIASLSGTTLTGVSAGTAHITATFGALTASLNVQVTGTTTAGGPVTGLVTNAQTSAPIVGALVLGGVAPVTTGSDGSFALAGVPSAGTISVSATGFVPTQYFNVILLNGAAQIGDIPLAPTSTLNGVINGQIIDATTGSGINSTTVTLRPGINATSGTGASTTTDEEGFYSISLPAGTYTASATAPTFSNGTATVVSLGDETQNNQNVSLVPNTGLRITLTWGANPPDLDSHLFGPTATPGVRFETAYYAREGPDGETLDRDATEGFGPENSSVPTLFPGIYRFYVYHFCCANASMAASGTTVTVRLNGTTIGVFHPPARPNEQPGDVWEVFSLDGSTLALTSINQFVDGFVDDPNCCGGEDNIRARTARVSAAAAAAGTASSEVTTIKASVKAHPKPPRPLKP